jgi:hypothetical protein
MTEDGADAGFGQGDIWRLQFWPAPGDLEPPRWLVRTESPTGDAGDGTDEGDDLADDRAPVALTALADATPDYGEPQPIPMTAVGLAVAEGLAFAAPDTGDNAGDTVFVSTPARSSLPYGPPPAAGIVTSNQELVVWRAGLPAVLATVERHAERALATPYGIVVIGSKLAVLVRPNGEQLELAPSPESRAVLSDDGQYIAIASSKLGRRPKFGLYLANLVDGSAQVLDLPGLFQRRCRAPRRGALRLGRRPRARMLLLGAGDIPR